MFNTDSSFKFNANEKYKMENGFFELKFHEKIEPFVSF